MDYPCLLASLIIFSTLCHLCSLGSLSKLNAVSFDTLYLCPAPSYPLYIASSSIFLRYAYSDDTHEEFDKDDTDLRLIRPSPISSPSKDVRSVPDFKPLRGNDNPAGDLEEDKTE